MHTLVKIFSDNFLLKTNNINKIWNMKDYLLKAMNPNIIKINLRIITIATIA